MSLGKQGGVKSAVEEIKKSTIKKQSNKKDATPIKCGASLIDLVVGGYLPYGFVNIVGDSSSGKSACSGEIIASAYHRLGKDGVDWFYDDAEGGYKFDSSKLYGFDIIKEGFLKPERRSTTLEDFEKNIYDIIKKKNKDTPFIYVLDSFDSITSDEELKFKEKQVKKRTNDDDGSDSEKKNAGSYNLAKQKGAHSFFRTKIRELENNKIVLIIVSQVKEKIGISFGSKYYRTGGKALDFYPNVILWLAEVQKYERQKRAVGICSKIKATKSRNDKPFRDCLVDFLFDFGLDNVASNINFLYDLKTEGNKDRKTLSCDWDGSVFDRSELITYIEKNNLEDDLEKRVIEKWDTIEEEISNKDRKPRWGR